MALFKRKTSADKDYTLAMLPSTRKEVFFDVLKLEWKRFLIYGLIMLLFSLPLHILAVFEEIAVGNVILDTAFTDNEKILEAFATKNAFALFEIVAFVIMAIGVAGISRIIRQHAFLENVFFGVDFFKGIKTNGLQLSLLGLFAGIVNYIISVTRNQAQLELITGTGAGGFLSSLWMNMPTIIAVLIGIPTAAFMVVCITVYSNKFHRQLTTAFGLVIRKPFKNLLVLALCLAVYLLELIPGLYTMIVVRLVVSILSPFVYLIWHLYSLNHLDEFINKEYFPELVGKGLTPKEEAE